MHARYSTLYKLSMESVFENCFHKSTFIRSKWRKTRQTWSTLATFLYCKMISCVCLSAMRWHKMNKGRPSKSKASSVSDSKMKLNIFTTSRCFKLASSYIVILNLTWFQSRSRFTKISEIKLFPTLRSYKLLMRNELKSSYQQSTLHRLYR